MLSYIAVSQVNTEAMRNTKERSGFANTLGFDFGFENSKIYTNITKNMTLKMHK